MLKKVLAYTSPLLLFWGLAALYAQGQGGDVISSIIFNVPHSTTLPATCNVGDAYMDTDATTGERWYLCESTNTWVKQGGSGGSSSFTASRNLPVSGVKFPTSNPATLDRSENNDRLLFDASTSECVMWQFMWPVDYASGGALRVIYSMTSATSGGVSIDASVMAVTPGDAVDGNTDSYDTVNNCDDATVPGTAGFFDVISCTLTNKDSVAAGDIAKIKLCRAVADSADTATGDMEVTAVELSYTH
jgi:hypothetical protein